MIDNEKYDLQERVEMARSLLGILSSDITLEEAREERLSENGNIDSCIVMDALQNRKAFVKITIITLML